MKLYVMHIDSHTHVWAWGRSVFQAAVCMAYRMGGEYPALTGIYEYGVK